MVELLSKLETYRIFNYLYPGTLFLFACSWLDVFELKDQNLLINAFLAYFCGMTISRVGSIMIEKPLKIIGFIKHCPYEDYVQAEKKDDKIKILLEEANAYRTLIATALAVMLIGLAKYLVTASFIQTPTILVLAFIAVIVLYLFAYKKQVGFVTRRVNANNKTN